MLQIGVAFALVVDILGAEEDNLIFKGKTQLLACFLLVNVAEYVVGDAVVDVHYLGVRHRLFGSVGNPLAATYEGDITFPVQFLFALVKPVGNAAGQKRTVPAICFLAVASVMLSDG